MKFYVRKDSIAESMGFKKKPLDERTTAELIDDLFYISRKSGDLYDTTTEEQDTRLFDDLGKLYRVVRDELARRIDGKE